MCYHRKVMAEVAREINASGDFEGAIHRLSQEAEFRWRESKYVKLYNDELAAGRDPHKAFEERNWEM
jgi:hypothetical protein